jgi:hypothetical protein
MAVKLRMIPQTVPNRPTKGRHRADRGEDVKANRELVDLLRQRRMHDEGEAGSGALAVDALAAGRAAPFGDPGGEHLGARDIGLAPGLVEAVDIVRLPEIALEGLRAQRRPAQLQGVADDDRPRPDAGQEQADDDRLDDEVRLQEQSERRHVGSRQRVFVHSRPSLSNRLNASVHSRG